MSKSVRCSSSFRNRAVFLCGVLLCDIQLCCCSCVYIIFLQYSELGWTWICSTKQTSWTQGENPNFINENDRQYIGNLIQQFLWINKKKSTRSNIIPPSISLCTLSHDERISYDTNSSNHFHRRILWIFH